jgi:hypothetical protein
VNLRHLLWLPLVGVVAFAAAFVFGDLLALPVDLSYVVYFAAIGTVIVLDAKRTGLDMRHRSSHRRHASRARAPHLD